MQTRTLTTDRGDAGRRLDLVLKRHLSDVPAATRTRIQDWIEAGHVEVNGSAVRKVAARAMLGDTISVGLAGVAPRQVMTAEHAGLDVLDILHEDEHLLAVNKPAGLVVHPTYRHATGTLMNALLWHARDWPPPFRPALVGRLDKLTSGVLLVSKSSEMHAALQRALTSRDAAKDYLALVYGRVAAARGRIDWRLGRDAGDRRRVVASRGAGAASVTEFERLARTTGAAAGLTLVRCRLVTGRTHQIRVHLAAEGWPIVGDPAYGEPRWSTIADPSLASKLKAFPRQALHAWRLSFRHPVHGEPLVIEAPLPADLKDVLEAAGLSYP